MKIKKSLYTTGLFFTIFVVGILVLFLLTRNVLNNSNCIGKATHTVVADYNA